MRYIIGKEREVTVLLNCRRDNAEWTKVFLRRTKVGKIRKKYKKIRRTQTKALTNACGRHIISLVKAMKERVVVIRNHRESRQVKRDMEGDYEHGSGAAHRPCALA